MKDLLKRVKEYNQQSVHYEAPYLDKDDMQKIEKVLEKQIPMKPVKDKYDHDCCPDCGWIVYQNEYGGRYLPHCENCGQAIDWN